MKKPPPIPYVSSPVDSTSDYDNLSASRAAGEAYAKRVAEREAPGRRQHQANMRARRFAALDNEWRAGLDKVLSALEEMSVICREAERMRAETGTVAVEAPHPTSSPERESLRERLRALLSEVSQ